MAKSFLDAKGVSYQEIDVAADKASRDEMISKSGQMAVPVIDIGGDLMIGFDETQLKVKLDL